MLRAFLMYFLFKPFRNFLHLSILLLALSISAFADSFESEWKDVSKVLSKAGFVHPWVAKELATELTKELKEELSVQGDRNAESNQRWVMNSPLTLQASSDLNLQRLMNSVVFQRHQVGIEALNLHASVAHLDLEQKKAVYEFSRRVVSALILAGKGELQQELAKKITESTGKNQFARKFLHQLWTRFYDETGKMRSKHQRRTISVAYLHSNRGIGYQNRLPWGYGMKTDFERFKSLAIGHWGIRSSKEFESAESPGRFPGTENIVVSRRPDYEAHDCLVVNSIEKALEMVQADPEPLFYGGQIIYQQALERGLVDQIWTTRIFAELPFDTIFPAFNESQYVISEETLILQDQDSTYPFQFVIYERK